MRYLALGEVLWLHGRLLATSGGAAGVRDFGRLQAALEQPKATWDDADLYPDLQSKAAALCFGLVLGHPFVDGNKRIGHAAMEMFLLLNGFTLDADVGDAERVMLALAAGSLTRDELLEWIRSHIAPMGDEPG